MRWYRDPKTGRDALWLDEHEIESTMEDQLRKAGLYPKSGKLVVDLERLLERHLKVELDRTAELDATVLGVTEFRPPKNPRVAINRELTGSALDDDCASRAVVGRWRATVAHEASHVILHRVLFEMATPSLFGGAAAPPSSMQCLKREVSFRRTSPDWREVQANRGMAALLMPKTIFLSEARSVLGAADSIAEGSRDERTVADALADRFETSLQVAIIRLRTLRLSLPAAQPRLRGI